MKKIVCAILACAMCASVAVSFSGCGCENKKTKNTNSNSNSAGYKVETTAPDLEDENFGYYKLNNKEVKVTVYKGNEKNVTIPETVDGHSITVVGHSIFQANDNIESVTLPDTVTEIQDYAFSTCKNLTKVNIPEGVKTIGQNAFWNCQKLEEITLPSTLKKIDWYAFSATGLKSVTIPESTTLTELKEKVFFQCASLTEVNLPLTITKISADTFEQCSDDLVIKAYNGSYGISYAKQNNIKFEELAR